jgi:hypothetical protein
MLFCFNPLTPSKSRVTKYFYDGILISLGIYDINLGNKIRDRQNLPENKLFCLSSNHFGSGL